MTPITKNWCLQKFTAKGMIPIEKNILVVDEQGNEYEATYPKRAKGLVKKGRARFVSDDKICLACPPDKLEDDNMQNIDNNLDTCKLTMNYVLEQIEKIAQQTDYIMDTIEKLGQMVGANGPGDVAGCAKAEALGNVVKCRETTNQQLLKFYERMYDDLKESVPQKSSTIKRFEEMVEFLKTLNKEEFSEDSWKQINEAVQAQLSRNY